MHEITAALLSELYMPLFWRPQRCERPSAWIRHIPFAHWLITACAPRTFVELGTHTGASYAAFCQGVAKAKLDTRCYAIDTWRGDEHAGHYEDEVYDEVHNFNATHYAAFSELIRSTFDEALPFFADGSVDLLHIDGFHTYEAARHDLESWRPKLSSRAVVLFHDTNVKQGTFGVWKVFAEEAAKRPSFEFLHGHGLGLLAVGDDTPEAVMDLCGFSSIERVAVRERFALLGLRCESDFAVACFGAERAEVAREKAALDKKAAVIEGLKVEASTLRSQVAVLERQRGRHANGGLVALSARWGGLPPNVQILLTRLGSRFPWALKRQFQIAQEIRATGLFDEGFYRVENPYVDQIAMDPALHFAVAGWKLDRKPNPYFLPSYYIGQCADGTIAHMNPLLHYARTGWKLGLRPSPQFDAEFYLEMYPDVAAAKIDPLLHFLNEGRHEGRAGIAWGDLVGGEASNLKSIHDLVREHNAPWASLPVYEDAEAEPTLTIVMDGLGKNDCPGSVDAAVVVGALAAARFETRLRIVTRRNAVDPAMIGDVLRAHKLEWSGATDFVQIPFGTEKPLAVGRHDLFLTTSWQTTAAVAGSVAYEKILYLVQEDERTSSVHGEACLRCSEVLSSPQLRVLVRTRLLLDHLAEGPNAVDGLRDRAQSFEPACPAFPRPEDIPARSKKNFLFHACSRNGHALLWRGIEVISVCLQRGILNPEGWNFHFMGADAPPMARLSNLSPVYHRDLARGEYAELVRTIDLGLCLTATPRPYPVLDLAASGAVVVTNAFGAKNSFDSLSSNVLTVPMTVSGLSAGVEQGAILAKDTTQRRDRCLADNIARDWHDSQCAVDGLKFGAR